LLFWFSALRSLHDEALVHADLKPANVMWSSPHQCFKLVDFGLTFFTTEKYIHRIQTKGTV
jgi:serine/threonine protein kinase